MSATNTRNDSCRISLNCNFLLQRFHGLLCSSIVTFLKSLLLDIINCGDLKVYCHFGECNCIMWFIYLVVWEVMYVYLDHIQSLLITYIIYFSGTSISSTQQMHANFWPVWWALSRIQLFLIFFSSFLNLLHWVIYAPAYC